jgi:hypothetical protein
MKKIVILSLLAVIGIQANALNKKNACIKQTTSEAGISIGSNGYQSFASLATNQYWKLGKNQKHLQVGLGVRLTLSFGGKNINYMTDDPAISSGHTGLGSIFTKRISKNIDTLNVSSTQVNTMNAVLYLRYELNPKWAIDFNMDLAGFAFGGSKSSTLTYGEQSDATRTTNAKPSPRNVLLFSAYNRGSFYNELMLSYLYKKDIRLKAGFSSLNYEYTIDNPVLYTNTLGTVIGIDRYRMKTLCFGVGVNYIFKQKKY